MIVGITGGTGCGKTTALEAFAHLGGAIIDCDKLYHQMLATDTDMASAIKARFPQAVNEGALDRKALGAIVFSDAGALEDLNRITHSHITAEIRKQLALCEGHIAIDAIGLLESGLGELCDVTIAVTAGEHVRIARIMERDNITEEYAKKRILAQKDESFFRKNCDYILENNRTKQAFYNQCLAFFQGLGIMKEDH